MCRIPTDTACASMNVAKAALRTAEALICPAAYQRLCKIPWVSLGIFHIDTYIIIHIYIIIYIHIRIHRYVAGWYKGYLQKIHLSHVDVNPSVKMVVPKNGVHPPKMAMWIENMMKHQIWDLIWFHMFYLNVSSIEMLINLPCIIMYLVKHLDLTKWQNELHHPRTKWTSPGKSGPHQSLDLHFWVQTNVNV